MHALTWMNLKSISKRSQTRKTTYYIILIIWNFQRRQRNSDRKQISSCLGWGVTVEADYNEAEGTFQGRGWGGGDGGEIEKF